MRLDVSKLTPPPVGFPDCKACPYRDVGSAAVCFSCALNSLDPLSTPRCPVCEHPVKPPRGCQNPVCGWGSRGFDRVWAISTDGGALNPVIRRYKFYGDRNWAEILGRLLAGFLDDNPGVFGSFDLITPTPAFTGQGAARSWEPAGEIFRVAAIAAQRPWPFDLATPRAVEQTAAVARFVEQPTWAHRKALAEGPLRAALNVPDPARVAGKSILVFDDVFTDGLRAREVARALRSAGASSVSQVVLARHLFTGDP